jgi:hypothetical protein
MTSSYGLTIRTPITQVDHHHDIDKVRSIDHGWLRTVLLKRSRVHTGPIAAGPVKEVGGPPPGRDQIGSTPPVPHAYYRSPASTISLFSFGSLTSIFFSLLNGVRKFFLERNPFQKSRCIFRMDDEAILKGNEFLDGIIPKEVKKGWAEEMREKVDNDVMKIFTQKSGITDYEASISEFNGRVKVQEPMSMSGMMMLEKESRTPTVFDPEGAVVAEWWKGKGGET